MGNEQQLPHYPAEDPALTKVKEKVLYYQKVIIDLGTWIEDPRNYMVEMPGNDDGFIVDTRGISETMSPEYADTLEILDWAFAGLDKV